MSMLHRPRNLADSLGSCNPGLTPEPALTWWQELRNQIWTKYVTKFCPIFLERQGHRLLHLQSVLPILAMPLEID
eukprot:12556015-Ditylum_brightwellii.AAC.2